MPTGVYIRTKKCRQSLSNARKGKFIGKLSPSWKQKIKKRCIFCNNKFEVHPYREDSAKFCSGSCSAKYLFSTNRNPNIGRKVSDKSKSKMSISHKGQISIRKGKTNIEMFGKEKAEILKQKNRESTIKQLKRQNINTDTLPERIVENYLLFNNILYVKQYVYKLGVADFWLPEINTIIEADGDYWHSSPKVIDRDERQTKWLEENDYIVYHFKERDIKKDINECFLRIKS